MKHTFQPEQMRKISAALPVGYLYLSAEKNKGKIWLNVVNKQQPEQKLQIPLSSLKIKW